MKRGLVLALVFLFLIANLTSIIFAKAQETNVTYDPKYNSLELELNISNEINPGSDSSVNVTLSIFPRNDYSQEVLFSELIDSDGNSIEKTQTKNSMQFWSTKKDRINQFTLISKIKSNYYNPEINETIYLSELIKDIPDEILKEAKYQDGDYIDFNDPFIKNKALQLATTNDALEALNNFADYVNKNMIYDLNSQDLKKASEIMQNKRGVCGHYATLFMALTRSIGLPTKYVTGMTYSTIEKKFREHAWAEVWLGDEYGWVPYDPTLGEYGWLDAYHIKLKESHDSSTKAIEYQYTGEIAPGKINITTEIVEFGELNRIPFSFSIRPIIAETGLDSYVPLEIKARSSYYFSLPVYLVSAPDFFGAYQKTILLKPNQDIVGYLLLHTPNTGQCQNGCISDIEVKDIFDNYAKSQLLFGKDKGVITLEEAQQIIPRDVISSNLDVFCKPGKNYYYDYETGNIICIAENREQQDRNIGLCLNDICNIEEIAGQSSKEYSLNFNVSSQFKNQTLFQPMSPMIKCISLMEGLEQIGVSCVNFVVLRTPDIKFEPIESKRIKYDGKTMLSLNVTANTNIDLNISLSNNELRYEDKNTFWLKNGVQTIGFVIDTNKIKELKPGVHTIKVLSIYTDKNNKEYYKEDSFDLEIEDTNFLNKFWISIKRFFV